MRSWNSSGCPFLIAISLQEPADRGHGVYLSPSLGEEPICGAAGQGRRQQDQAAPPGQPSWVTSALKGPLGKVGDGGVNLFSAQSVSLHKHVHLGQLCL